MVTTAGVIGTSPCSTPALTAVLVQCLLARIIVGKNVRCLPLACSHTAINTSPPPRRSVSLAALFEVAKDELKAAPSKRPCSTWSSTHYSSIGACCVHVFFSHEKSLLEIAVFSVVSFLFSSSAGARRRREVKSRCPTLDITSKRLNASWPYHFEAQSKSLR